MIAIILVGVLVLLVLWCISLYNNLVRMRNNRENAFANIDVQLKQRRSPFGSDECYDSQREGAGRECAFECLVGFENFVGKLSGVESQPEFLAVAVRDFRRRE